MNVSFARLWAAAIFLTTVMVPVFGAETGTGVIQIDVGAVLNARAVATYTEGKIVPLTADVDGAGGLITRTVAEKLGEPNPHPLPDDGVFAATEKHPRVVLHFSNADGEHNQIRRSEGEDRFAFYTPEKKYSQMLLFFSSGHFGPAKIQIKMSYADATSETRDMEAPDWYFPLPPNDPDRCYLATNLGKWNKENKMIEKDHHFIYGLEIHPAPAKILSRIEVHKLGTCVLAFWGATGVVIEPQTPGEVRELIQDPHFQRGFILWQPEPGKHVRYGALKVLDAAASPVWGLDQWSSKFPLSEEGVISGGGLIYSNSAKAVALGTGADVSLADNASVEYGGRARKSAGEPWVHLLVEQEFEPPAPLADLSAAKLHVEARLLHSRLAVEKDYTPDLHAAQFQIYFTVQNRNRESRGYGDLVWFGVLIYDNRARFPHAFKEQDFGGTAKFIFSPDGRVFSSASAQDGEWIIIDKDLLSLMREALETAWARGFLTDSKNFADYTIGGMNMGWELPGVFDVEMQIRNLSLKVVQAPPRAK